MHKILTRGLSSSSSRRIYGVAELGGPISPAVVFANSLLWRTASISFKYQNTYSPESDFIPFMSPWWQTKSLDTHSSS